MKRKNKRSQEKRTREPMTREQFKKKIFSEMVDLIYFIVGSAIFALGVDMFAVPNSIPCGGATGVAVIVNSIFSQLPVGGIILAINIPLFILGFIILGVRFLIKSFVATIILSVMTDLLAPVIPAGTNDMLLASLFYGITSGLGLAIIFLRNATSGGSDIVAKLVNRRFPSIPMGRAVFFTDAIVIVASGFVYKSIEIVLYASIVSFVTGEVIDLIMYGMDKGKTFFIITDKADRVKDAILSQTERGVTVAPVKGGYTGDDKQMLICAVRNSEAPKLNNIVRGIDSHAFTIVAEVGEILGEGFKDYNSEEN